MSEKQKRRYGKQVSEIEQLIRACLAAYIQVEDWGVVSVRRVRPSGYRSHLDDSLWSSAAAELPADLTDKAARVRTALRNVDPWVPELPALIRHYNTRGSIRGFYLERGELRKKGKSVGTAFGMLRVTEEDIVRLWWGKLIRELRRAIEVAPFYTTVE